MNNFFLRESFILYYYFMTKHLFAYELWDHVFDYDDIMEISKITIINLTKFKISPSKNFNSNRDAQESSWSNMFDYAKGTRKVAKAPIDQPKSTQLGFLSRW